MHKESTQSTGQTIQDLLAVVVAADTPAVDTAVVAPLLVCITISTDRRILAPGEQACLWRPCCCVCSLRNLRASERSCGTVSSGSGKFASISINARGFRRRINVNDQMRIAQLERELAVIDVRMNDAANVILQFEHVSTRLRLGPLGKCQHDMIELVALQSAQHVGLRRFACAFFRIASRVKDVFVRKIARKRAHSRRASVQIRRNQQ
jgi:hypothetical protein